MSGLFDDEGKTPARGRKHKAAEASMAELAKEAEYDELAADDAALASAPTNEDEAPIANISLGHPFEDSIKAAKAIADDYAPGLPGYVKTGSDGNELYKGQTPGPFPGDQVNRFPISQERRAKILNLVWERTRWRTGRVEWRDLRDLLKEVIELM